VAERKEHSNGHRTLPGGDQASGHQVNGGDVIRIQGMAQSERVR
jgi:hypothetical protein